MVHVKADALVIASYQGYWFRPNTIPGLHCMYVLCLNKIAGVFGRYVQKRAALNKA
jgi:hypothetical protein